MPGAAGTPSQAVKASPDRSGAGPGGAGGFATGVSPPRGRSYRNKCRVHCCILLPTRLVYGLAVSWDHQQRKPLTRTADHMASNSACRKLTTSITTSIPCPAMPIQSTNLHQPYISLRYGKHREHYGKHQQPCCLHDSAHRQAKRSWACLDAGNANRLRHPAPALPPKQLGAKT